MTRARTPHAIVQRFLRLAGSLDLAHQPIAVGFSGGPDSTALAICCAEATRALNLNVTLLHINHNARPESGSDAKRAAAIAARLDLPFKSADLTPTANPSEEHLRLARYETLSTLMANDGITTLLTAHHADDQAETLLMHLIRGSGPDGAEGMSMTQPFMLPGMAEFITLVRPLLRERRSALESLVAAYEIIPITDPSNADTKYRRNAIRHRVIPVLEELNPGAIEHLAQFAELIAEDNAALTAAMMTRDIQVADDGSLEVNQLADLPTPFIRRALRSWVRAQTDLVLTFDRTMALVDLAKSGNGGAIVQIGEGWTVHRTGRTLKIHDSTDQITGGNRES